MSLSDETRLKHIADEVLFLLDLVTDKSIEEVLDDPIKYRAVARSIEIIGEASKQLSSEFKENHPSIDWRKIGDARNFLIHVYFSVDNAIIWNILMDHVPMLKTFLDSQGLLPLR